MVYLILALAIVFEIIGLTALKEANGFTRLVPTALFALALGASFYFESLALRFLPIGLTYTLWAGLGIVGMTLVGATFYGEKLNPGVLLGIALIVGGVAVMHHWTPIETDQAEVVVR